MQFLKLASLFSIAALAGASSVTFKSMDDTDRTVYFTANAGMEAPGPVSVPGGQTVKVELSDFWTGNWYSVCDGEENVPGMLGEVSLNGWHGVSFYDVSAIVNPGDTKGVHLLYPADEPNTPVSGCDIFPCTNAYYFPDDLQTKGSSSSDLICTLGDGSPVNARDLEQPESPSFPRSFVERRW